VEFLIESIIMHFDLSADGQNRLQAYVDEIGCTLRHAKRRSSFAIYAMGLLGEGARKSMEPIAARACPDPDRVDAMHQRLHHFITDSNWSDRDVRGVARDYVLQVMTEHDTIEGWILDDTGFLKQGKHSVGVQRQYTGSAGKITNCQIGVSLSVATRREQAPIDFELYLPESWTDDPARRKEARIPDELEFKTKFDLGLDMIRRAVEDDIPRGVVLADSFYGDKGKFRTEIRGLGLHYAFGVSHNLTVWRVDKFGKKRGKKLSAS
jgi:SRSO17 transposase